MITVTAVAESGGRRDIWYRVYASVVRITLCVNLSNTMYTVESQLLALGVLTETSHKQK